jgi:NDP-sugar pyrophosphorylase family protein
MTEAMTERLFDLSHSLAGEFLRTLRYPWQALDRIGEWILAIGAGLDKRAYIWRGESVLIARSAKVHDSAVIEGPCIVGERCELRPCAYLRGNVLLGEGCVVGNSTELKNAILFDGVQVPHFNYVGDSILGYRAHLGASAVASNVRSDKAPVIVHLPQGDLATGRKKVGAMVGDGTEVGCGAILAPGAVTGRGSVIYPLSLVRGTVPEGAIYKSHENIIKRG